MICMIDSVYYRLNGKCLEAPEILTLSYLQIVNEFVNSLKPFGNCTKTLSCETYATGSQSISVIKYFKKAFNPQHVCTKTGREFEKILSD